MKRVIFIVLAVILLSTACTRNTSKLVETSVEPEFLPVFITPSDDSEHGNGLLGMSIATSEHTAHTMTIEYTLIFQDEDHPSALLDIIYDIYRRFKYKRIADTETFFITFKKTDAGLWTPYSINFPNVYSDHQQFYEKHVQHYTANITDLSALTFDQQRIIIYINTWNHMIAHFDTNPSLQKQIITTYPVYTGNREAVEAVYAH